MTLKELVSKELVVIKVNESDKYVFNKLVFGIGFLVLILSTVLYINSLGVDPKQNNVYIHCGNNSITPCENNLYQSPSCYKYVNNYICEMETLPIGFTYGSPPPPIYNNFTTYCVLYLIFLFLVNHVLHNWGFFKRMMRQKDDDNDKDNGDNE